MCKQIDKQCKIYLDNYKQIFYGKGEAEGYLSED